MLFNISLEWVMRETSISPDSITLTNGTVCDRLAYADDADLCGEGYPGRDQQLTNFNSAGKKVGLEVSEPKTKAMKSSRTERQEDFIELGEFLLEEVDHFKYLGSIISSTCTVEEEVMARIASVGKCKWAINELLKSNIISRARLPQSCSCTSRLLGRL